VHNLVLYTPSMKIELSRHCLLLFTMHISHACIPANSPSYLSEVVREVSLIVYDEIHYLRDKVGESNV